MAPTAGCRLPRTIGANGVFLGSGGWRRVVRASCATAKDGGPIREKSLPSQPWPCEATHADGGFTFRSQERLNATFLYGVSYLFLAMRG
jgi:hypothetical protein